MIGNRTGDGLERPWRIRAGTITHTDSARAYANLSRQPTANEADERRRNVDEGIETISEQHARLVAELEEGFQENRRVPEYLAKYTKQRYAATHVVHKKKRGCRRCFVKLCKVTLFDNREVWVIAGTQQVDGSWAGLRNGVARGGLQTWRTGALNRNLRVWQ